MGLTYLCGDREALHDTSGAVRPFPAVCALGLRTAGAAPWERPELQSACLPALLATMSARCCIIQLYRGELNEAAEDENEDELIRNIMNEGPWYDEVEDGG